MAHSFRPGDAVIWWKGAGGGFVAPIRATVVAVKARRVTIQGSDPDETGAGPVTRHVSPSSLQPTDGGTVRRGPKKSVNRGQGGPRRQKGQPADSFETQFPQIASWVQDGWVEIGRDDCGRSFVRALDIGGLVWEGDGPYGSLDEALRALDAGIAAWLDSLSSRKPLARRVKE